jgi:TonB-dependent receptor
VLGAISSPAVAQDDGIDEVVVTGIRASLAAAVDIKRNNVGVVDAITAEDMGKFPDGNLAEALSRIVGVAIDRSNIEGSKVAVRGFGPEFNLVTLNGRQMPTVPGQWGGGRSFDFGDISAHGFESVQVFKSPTSTLPTGGIGSTINIVTSKPLNAPGFKAAASYAVVDDTTNPDGGTDGEMDFVLSNTFLDGTVGISLSGSHSERNNREEGLQETTWFANVDSRFHSTVALNNTANLRADGATFTAEKAGFQIKDNNRVRDNAQLTLQFRPSESVTTTLDYTYSKVDFSTEGNTFGPYLGGWNMTAGTVNENGAIVAATYAAEEGAWPADYNENGAYGQAVTWGMEENINKSFGFNVEWQASDNLSLSLDAHDSSSKKVGTDGDNAISFINSNWFGHGDAGVYAQAGKLLSRDVTFGPTGLPTYDLGVERRFQGNAPEAGYTEFEGADMGSTNGTFSSANKANGMQQVQVKGDWVNADGLFMESLTSIQFGASRMQQKISDKRARNDIIQGAANDGTNTVLNFIFYDDAIFTRTSLDGFMDDASNGTNPEDYYLAMDVAAARDAFARAGWGPGAPGEAWWAANYANCDLVNDAAGTGFGATFNGDSTVRGDYRCALTAGDIDTDSSVHETLTSIFAQFNFETEVQGMPLNIVAGMRYEETDVVSVGLEKELTSLEWNLDTAGILIPVRSNDPAAARLGENSQFLPNLSMSLGISDNEVVRFAASRSLSRAGINDMRSVIELQSPTIYSSNGTTGNPDLKPLLADSFDLAYENYYAEGSYFAVNYFRKNLENFISSVSSDMTIGSVQDPTAGAIGLAAKENPATNCPSWCSPDQKIWWAAADGGLNTWNGGWWNSNINNAVAADPLAVFNISKPMNQEEGTVDGWEIALQHQFGDTGFGASINATFVGGDVEADTYALGDQFALPGFGDSANFSAFYEDDKWSATLGVNQRGETYAGLDGQKNPIFLEKRHQVDLTASFNVNDNLTVFAEARNITDEPVRIFVRHPEMIFLAQDHGPMYKFGVRANF